MLDEIFQMETGATLVLRRESPPAHPVQLHGFGQALIVTGFVAANFIAKVKRFL